MSKRNKNTDKKDDTKKEKSYKPFLEEYKGTEVIVVREVNSKGEPKDPNGFPLISMGRRKLEILLSLKKELKSIIKGE